MAYIGAKTVKSTRICVFKGFKAWNVPGFDLDVYEVNLTHLGPKGVILTLFFDGMAHFCA